MSDTYNYLKSWSDERIAEVDADDDDELSAAKFTEYRRRLKEKKAEEERKKAEEEAKKKAEAEEERQRAEEARQRVEDTKRRAEQRRDARWRRKFERLTVEERIAEVGGVAAVVAGLMAEAEKAKRMEGLEVGSELSESESSEDSEEELVEGMDEGV